MFLAKEKVYSFEYFSTTILPGPNLALNLLLKEMDFQGWKGFKTLPKTCPTCPKKFETQGGSRSWVFSLLN